MSIGPWQIAMLVLVVLVLFGRGRISEFMGDFGKGIKSFKSGMNEDDAPPASTSTKVSGQIEAPADSAVSPAPRTTPTDNTKAS